MSRVAIRPGLEVPAVNVRVGVLERRPRVRPGALCVTSRGCGLALTHLRLLYGFLLRSNGNKKLKNYEKIKEYISNSSLLKVIFNIIYDVYNVIYIKSYFCYHTGMHETQELAAIFNLSLNEAKAYLALVKEGPALVSKITMISGLPRMVVYPQLVALAKNGFVGVTASGKRRYYSAVEPEKLLELLDQRRSLLKNLIGSISKKEKISSPENSLDIVYYPGKNGIRTALQLFLDETTQKIWYSFENPADIAELIDMTFTEDYVNKRAEKGVLSKMILSSDTSWLQRFLDKDKEQLRETIRISPREYPFDSTIVATKGLTIMINGRESAFAVLIRNEYLARNLTSIHRLIWDRYRP